MAELTDHAHSAEMIAGSSGQFDVVADGETIFSKHREGRFPEPGEVLEKLPA